MGRVVRSGASLCKVSTHFSSCSIRSLNDRMRCIVKKPVEDLATFRYESKSVSRASRVSYCERASTGPHAQPAPVRLAEQRSLHKRVPLVESPEAASAHLSW